MDNIKEIKEVSREDTLTRGKIFSDNNEHPINTLWLKVFDDELNGIYWQLGHLPEEKRTVAVISALNGKIEVLEKLMGIPNSFITGAGKIEKAEK